MRECGCIVQLEMAARRQGSCCRIIRRLVPARFRHETTSQFIGWCRSTLAVPDTLLFETEDLVSRRNERNVLLCLLEVQYRPSALARCSSSGYHHHHHHYHQNLYYRLSNRNLVQ